MVKLWSNHIYTKIILEDDRLETFELFASSKADAIDREGVRRRTSDGIIQISMRYHVRIFTVLFPLQQLQNLRWLLSIQPTSDLHSEVGTVGVLLHISLLLPTP
jgi:hypothetical protein